MTNICSVATALDTNPLLLDQLLAPMKHVLDNYTRQRRNCSAIGDEEFIRMGFWRTLSQANSGRDFLQQQAETFDNSLQRSSFFDTLHSARGLRLLREASAQLYLQNRQRAVDEAGDLLAAFPELQGRGVWAVDGHKIEHACHALRDTKGRHVAPNTLYVLCLHSSFFLNLAPVQGDGRYHHEMPVFRDALPRFLRQELAPSKRGPRPLFILDPAFVDHQFWSQQALLRRSGALMIMRAKNDIAPKKMKPLAFDAEDLSNTGVDHDWRVSFEGGKVMRLVQYTDPESGERHQFLSTDWELRPGVIAYLYLLRWRIEKLFDTAKNKLEESKAWATGSVARQIQAHFLAMTHNLLVLFRGLLERDFGIREEKLEQRRTKHLEQRARIARRHGRQLQPLHLRMPRIVQLSLQFIRTLRNQILRQLSLKAALPRIHAMLLTYL